MTSAMPNYRRQRQRNWRRIRNDRLFNENQDFRMIEKMFWHYTEIKKEVEAIRAEMGYYQSHKTDGGMSSNRAFISDPTASVALRRTGKISKVIINTGQLNEDTISDPEDWITVVEQTMAHIHDDDVREVITRRFFHNEPTPTTCIELEINKNKYYILRDTGLRLAKECAIQLGLIRVF